MKKQFLYFMSNTLGRCMSTKLYLKTVYRIKVGKKLNLKSPTTYTEKLQWLKINYKNPIMVDMVDKYEAKNIASKLFGDEYIIKNYGVFESFDEIDFDKLPNSFVIKCTHDSGGVVVCKNKSKLDIKKARKKINKALKLNYYYVTREWPYKNIKPRIIVEEFLENENNDLNDYKVMCFNGKPYMIQYHSGRFLGEHLQDFYDLNWNKIKDLSQKGANPSNFVVEKPNLLEKMLSFSELAAATFPNLRVDWYIVNNKLYFGEFTFCDGSGFEGFTPDKINYELGHLIELKKYI